MFDIATGFWRMRREGFPHMCWTMKVTDPQGLSHLLHLGQLSTCVLVIPQVLLVSHEDYGNVGTEVLHLRRPFLRNIFCPGRDME